MHPRPPGPEASSSGEGHQQTSLPAAETESSSIVHSSSPPPPEEPSSETVPHQQPSVPSQINAQLQQVSTGPPALPPTATALQSGYPETNISIQTATRHPHPPPTTMHASASAVRPPVPLEPPTSTTLAELNRNGAEAQRMFQTGPIWEPEATLQNIHARMNRLQTIRIQLSESMEAYNQARSATAAHERTMVSATGEPLRGFVPALPTSGARSAVDDAYEVVRERLALYPTGGTRTRGPEITIGSSRSPQSGGPADDDDGVTLRGRRVMANQALGGNARQADPQADEERLQIVLNSITGSFASLPSRQLPSPFVGETTPLMRYPPSSAIPSSGPAPPMVIRVSSPTSIELPTPGGLAPPSPPHPPMQPSTIIEPTPSPVPPLAYPYTLPHIRYVFDTTGAPLQPTDVREGSNSPPPLVMSRIPSPPPFHMLPTVHYPEDLPQSPHDEPRQLRRRLDDSGRSVGISRNSPSPPPPPLTGGPAAIQEYIMDSLRTGNTSPSATPPPEIPSGWGIVYGSYEGTPGFVPALSESSSSPSTPRPSRSRPPRRSWRREDSNGDEIISDDEDTAAEQRQRDLRERSRLMSRSTVNVDQPYEALSLIARMESPSGRGDESNDQEKHGIDGLEDTLMSGSRSSSAGSSRPGSRLSTRGFDLNFTRVEDGEVPMWPCPLPVPPSEMVAKGTARQWRGMFSPPPPLFGSAARARAAALARGSRRLGKKHTDPLGR